jgi:hypothetical protein
MSPRNCIFEAVCCPHSPDYRSRYADNLGTELSGIPAVSLETMKIVKRLNIWALIILNAP